MRGTERKPVVLTTGELDALTGVYEAPEGQSRAISREGAQLFSQRIGGARYPLQAASTDVFFFPDSETALRFTRDARGKATGLRLEARLGPAEIYRRSDKPLPTVRREIALDARLLERLAGEYELMPGFTLRITVEEGHLMSQATGQGKFELFAETATRFFLKVVDAQVEFDLDQSGLATGLTLFQGGQRIPGRKVK